MLGWRRVSPASSSGRPADGAGGPVGAWPGSTGGSGPTRRSRARGPVPARPVVQGGVAARFHLAARAALAEAPGPVEARRAHEPVDDGPDHRLAALQALPDEALGGDPPDRRFDGRRSDAGPARRAGRWPAMTFPFHCMWTGIGREATQGNTSRCRVPLDVGDAAMVAALRPQSPCGKARYGCRTMPCRFAGRSSIAGQGEPAPEALRPRT